ncbi:MAG: anaerobic sulfatase maturase [Bryobacterales bacterium]|nr:anaerobic sulfatase maturase [Bryobacteraceae bacterium]MDW8129708.1 anaerobic sulfatase maturase [Bryobacterales bacterium]
MGSGFAFPILRQEPETTPRIRSLLIKPVSAVCNLDCAYCFYLDREADPYKDLPARAMTLEILERLVDSYLFYSYPTGVFAFQGGEPMLAGLHFYRRLVEYQKQYGRDGQSVSNALQTNAILMDADWCWLLREYNWLVGVSIDGPEPMHDRYRRNRGGQGTWRRVMRGIETLKEHKVEFNVLCVLSQANVEHPREVYRFFRSIGVDNIQYIPLAEFDGQGNPLPFTITPGQYGRFMLETFELWWPERRRVRIRLFDNIAEALAGQKPGNCTMHETCDSYVVVEYNGDVYPCDFFVERAWRLGNIMEDTWPEIARRRLRLEFASKKALPRPECRACEFEAICHGGCPKLRHGPHRRFEDLDYFCEAYKMIYARVLEPLRKEVARLCGPQAQRELHPPSPY